MKRSLFVVVICAFAVLPVYADLTFYEGSSGKTAFEASTTISVLETFESIDPYTPGVNIYGPITLQGITYTPISSSTITPNLHIAPPGYTNFGVPVTTSSILTASGNEDFSVGMSFGSPITAVGFDTYLNQYDVTVTTSNSEGSQSRTISHPATEIGFFGVTSTSPITSIRWTAFGGEVTNTGIDNVQVGVVPVPGAFLLGSLGLGFASWRLKRRKMA